MAISVKGDSGDPMVEPNVIPLVDIMLVLLIIFIITIPVMTHAVKIDLPRASNEKLVDKPENVRLSVDASGAYYWNETPIADAELNTRLSQIAAMEPQPELHMRGDKDVRYERVALAMASAQRAGVRKIGFITEPAQP